MEEDIEKNVEDMEEEEKEESDIEEADDDQVRFSLIKLFFKLS
jgi:hypothetical protein